MKFSRPLFFLGILSLLVASIFFPPSSNADPLDNWHWRNPLPQGNTLNAVTYGNGLFVAVGDRGTIVTSSDGIDWTVRSSGTDSNLYGVAYRNGFFVCVGKYGIVLASADAITWIQRSSGTVNDLRDVTYGNNLFVAVGDKGTILTSSDSVGWSSRNSATTATLATVAYGDGIFIAAGPPFTPCSWECPPIPAQILISSDGVAWTRQSIANTDSVNDVAFANGVFFAVNGNIFSSPDGLSWSQSDAGISNVLNGIAYGNGTIVSLGNDGIIVVSSDGRTWAQQSSGTTEDLYGIAYGNDIFVAVGKGGIILASSDGKKWFERARGRVARFAGIVYEKGTFVTVGSNGTILTSPDGTNWTQRPSGTDRDLYGLTFGNGTFVAVGNSNPNGTPPLCPGVPFPIPCPFKNTILVSSNGMTWADSLGHVPIQTYNGIAYGNETFVALASYGVIISSDGVTWREIPLQWEYLYDIRFGNGTFVIVGADGLILSSSDGINWTKRASGIANQNLYRLAFGNDLFVTVGGVDAMLTSPNGIIWTRVTRPNWFFPSTVVYLYDRFLVFGNGRLISRDGVNWEQSQSTVYDAFIGSAAYGNNTVVAVGSGGAILQSDPLSGNCTAALSSSFSLTVPSINFNSSYLTADLHYDPNSTGDVMFKVTSAAPVLNSSDYSGCQSSALSFDNNYKLHIPAITYNNLYYWADLEYVPSADGQTWFKLTGAGRD